jgi:hypothetical protein
LLKHYFRAAVLGCALFALPLTAAHAQLGQNFTGSGTYTGNGGTGFGGTIGNGSLTLTHNAGVINGSFAPSGSFSGNDLVLYIGTSLSGIADTSTLNDNGDGGRTAISGVIGNGRTLATFANGFRPSFALSIEPGFAGLFNIVSNTSNFAFVNSANIAGTGTGPFTFSFNVSDLGLNPALSNNIDFVGSFISTTAYRSNETFGTSVTVPGTAGDAPNAGFVGTQTFSTFNRLTTIAPVVVPESGSLALIGAGILPIAVVALRRRRAA